MEIRKAICMKAQVYSIIVILLTVPLVLFIGFYITSSQSVNIGVVERIVADQEHEIEKSVEEDFVRALEISAKRGLLAASNKVITDGIPLSNATLIMNELLINGTLEGNETYVMVNNTLTDWRDRILNVTVGFNIYLEFYNLLIENHDGFNIKLGVDIEVNVSDNLNISRIDRNPRVQSLSSVEGLEDPLFPLNTGGHIKRLIKRYPYPYYAKKIVSGSGNAGCSGNVSFDPTSPNAEEILVVHDASGVSGFRGVVSETTSLPSVSCYIVGASNAVDKINATIQESGYNTLYLDNETLAVWSLPLVEGLKGGYYYPEPGPDIFQRLEANLSENINGFESFVNTTELSFTGIIVKENQSVIDHLYFSTNVYEGGSVRGFPEWFKIDAAHAEIYNISELL